MNAKIYQFLKTKLYCYRNQIEILNSKTALLIKLLVSISICHIIFLFKLRTIASENDDYTVKVKVTKILYTNVGFVIKLFAPP